MSHCSIPLISDVIFFIFFLFNSYMYLYISRRNVIIISVAKLETFCDILQREFSANIYIEMRILVVLGAPPNYIFDQLK